MRRLVLVALALAAIALGSWATLRRGHSGPAQPDNPTARGAPAPVVLADARIMAVPLDIRTFGTVAPLATVTLRSQITGTLTNVLFNEGQEVKEGDLLFVIDPRPQEALLRQAESIRARDAALLANAEREARRQDELFKSGVASEESRDQARTQVETLRAQLQAEDAAIDQARLQLSYCRIASPLTGRIGARQADAGNLVKANDTPLATLNRVKPIEVRFTLPQQELCRVRARMAQGALAVMVTLPDGATSRTGVLAFVDNAVDTATGTIAMKARFDNADESLWPGQFVPVTVRLAMQDDALVVPARCVLPGQKGAYVYVAQPDNTVSSRVIRVDRTVGDIAVIAAGLEAGERVVADGQLRLGPGARIAPKPSEPRPAPSRP